MFVRFIYREKSREIKSLIRIYKLKSTYDDDWNKFLFEANEKQILHH